MPVEPLFADHRHELVPGLSDANKAIRDRQLYATTASDLDPGAADRIEVESEADAAARMAIERPRQKSDMPMSIERGGRQ